MLAFQRRGWGRAEELRSRGAEGASVSQLGFDVPRPSLADCVLSCAQVKVLCGGCWDREDASGSTASVIRWLKKEADVFDI